MNSWNAIRDWLTLAAATASAVFAGLIWWLARQRLGTRYEIWTTGLQHGGYLPIHVRITNRGDRDLMVERLSVQAPTHIMVSPAGSRFGVAATQSDLHTAKKVSAANAGTRIKPESTEELQLLLSRDGGFKSLKTVSIWLHILTSFPVIRHKKKQLTLILPASIRNSQE